MKRITIILVIIAALSAAGCAVSSVIAAKRAVTIKELRATVTQQEGQIAELKEYSKRLAEINGINIEVKFEMTQKNVLSVSNVNAQAIAKEVCQLTRQQVLDSLTYYNNYQK